MYNGQLNLPIIKKEKMDYKTKIKGMFLSVDQSSLASHIQIMRNINYTGRMNRKFNGLLLIDNGKHINSRPKFTDRDDMCNSFILEGLSDKDFVGGFRFLLRICDNLTVDNLQKDPLKSCDIILSKHTYITKYLDIKVVKMNGIYVCKISSNGKILDVTSHKDKDIARLISVIKVINGLTYKNLVKESYLGKLLKEKL